MKDLNYWKNNAEEDYIKTPISVLRYITELEKEQEKAISVTRCCETFKEDRKEDVENSAYGNWFDHQRYS